MRVAVNVDSEEGKADVDIVADTDAVAVWVCNAVFDNVGKADPLIVAVAEDDEVCDDDELLVVDGDADNDE